MEKQCIGYRTVNKDALSEENKFCKAIIAGCARQPKSQYGRRAQMALKYDMTFLIVLLTVLYAPDGVTQDRFVCAAPFEEAYTSHQ